MDKKFQEKIFNKFKDHKTTEDFALKTIKEMFIPFWQCKQKIVVEKNVEIDRFSKIILELINNDVSSHKAICDFLGIKDTDFAIMQFHYLLKNELMTESIQNDEIIYKVTHIGNEFLRNKTKIQNLETIDFEYYYSDLTQDFFDINKRIDKGVSQKSKRFLGYKIFQTHKLNNSVEEFLTHKNRPTLNVVKQNDFVSFFNNQKKDSTFYDFEDNTIESHKSSIKFLLLEYENDEDSQKEYEIRHSKNSVCQFEGYTLESKLSSAVTKYYQY
ncbi:hypothetical protein [Kordia sp.]|uniref:hypothetical protein n=1 Tax=Kordia sp. TaxID=1965332 RepID=UPI003D2C5031